MTSPRRVIYICAAFLAALSVPRAQAWDAAGHELIDELAMTQLNPKARAAVNELARGMMGTHGRPYTALYLGCWLDDIKRNPEMADHDRFKSWHYIDLPIDSRDPMPSFDPAVDSEAHTNAVQALKRALVVLKGGTDPYIKDKATACAMVMHLVGDLHQPLHCATKYFFSHGELRQDNGGNREDVLNGPPDAAKFNLHFFWDSAYRATFDPTTGDVAIDASEYDGHPALERLRGIADELKSGPAPDAAQLAPDFETWARQGNAIARDFVYHDITATDDRKSRRLSSAYVAKARQISCAQLRLAAYRLAQVLNDTLGVESPAPPPPAYPARE